MPKKKVRTRRRAPAARAGQPLRAADLMSRNPITVRQDMTVAELCDLFQEKNINGAPVVDLRGRLVGVVAQDDIIYGAMGNPAAPRPGADQGPAGDPEAAERSPERRTSRRVVAMLRQRHLAGLPDTGPRPGEKPFWADARPVNDPLRMPVSAIMTSPAISAEEETPLRDLCHVMWKLRIHRIPVVREGRVTGLVSSLDLCRAILDGLIGV
jgi:CBS domain-containing protein